MKAQKSRFSLNHIATNLILAVLIGALYFATTLQAPFSGTVWTNSATVYRGTKKNKVALQCEVSWNAAAMDGILKTLKEKKITITFCVSGEWAKQNTLMLKRIVENGHELGTMGMYPFEDGNVEWLESDILASLDVIESGCGTRPKIYYSGGRNVDNSNAAAKRCGVTQVLCTVDLLCARDDGDKIVSRACNGQIDGSIMLIQPTEELEDCLTELIGALREKGCEITVTGEVIK